jgi:energy-converting hydrogenase Eha subunit F
MDMTGEREIEAVEQWFRRRGLPAVVRGRPAQLLVRIAPAVVFIAAWQVLTAVLSAVDGETDADFDRLLESDLFALGYGGLLLGLVVVPGLGSWLTARWVRRKLVERGGPGPAAVMAAVFVVVVPIVDRIVEGDSLPLGLVTQLAILVGLFAAAFVGVGSIVGWALRAAFRQLRLLGELTTRVLPLLLLFTVFGFFTTEIWQVGSALPRARMWLVVGLFAVVAVVFLLAVLKAEVTTLTQSRTAPVGLDKLRETPLAPFLADGVPAERVPLTKLERANMILVLVLTQVLQTLMVATVMFVFFVIFGIIAIQYSVIKAWISRDPTTGTLFGIQLPIPQELLHVSLFIAAFSGLYFAASTVTDAKYRSAYFDPLADHLAVSLVARDLYLLRLPGTPRRAEPAAEH